MAERLFLQRQRCKTCRGNLGKMVNDPVLFGLYCSPKCAGIANLATRPEDAPRECTTVRDGVHEASDDDREHRRYRATPHHVFDLWGRLGVAGSVARHRTLSSLALR